MKSLNFSAAFCQFWDSMKSRPSRKICIDAVFAFCPCTKRLSLAMSWLCPETLPALNSARNMIASVRGERVITKFFMVILVLNLDGLVSPHRHREPEQAQRSSGDQKRTKQLLVPCASKVKRLRARD